MYQLSIVRIIGKGFDDGEKYQGLDLRRLAYVIYLLIGISFQKTKAIEFIKSDSSIL